MKSKKHISEREIEKRLRPLNDEAEQKARNMIAEQFALVFDLVNHTKMSEKQFYKRLDTILSLTLDAVIAIHSLSFAAMIEHGIIDDKVIGQAITGGGDGEAE